MPEALVKRQTLVPVFRANANEHRIEVERVPLLSWCSKLTKHASNIQSAACVAPSEDEQVMLEHVEALNSY
jgi:hypothetical protein